MIQEKRWPSYELVSPICRRQRLLYRSRVEIMVQPTYDIIISTSYSSTVLVQQRHYRTAIHQPSTRLQTRHQVSQRRAEYEPLCTTFVAVHASLRQAVAGEERQHRIVVDQRRGRHVLHTERASCDS